MGALRQVMTLQVFNVEEISLPDAVTFEETKDHSKWAIAFSSSQPWVCIGDINRQVGCVASRPDQGHSLTMVTEGYGDPSSSNSLL